MNMKIIFKYDRLDDILKLVATNFPPKVAEMYLIRLIGYFENITF